MKTLTSKSAILITGQQLVSLMRFHNVTIRELKNRMGFTMKRIREVRETGLSHEGTIRDWVQGVSGRDPGDLTKWFAVQKRMQSVLKGIYQRSASVVTNGRE